MASSSATLRPVCCCSIIAIPASGFRLGKDNIRSTDSGSAHRCTFSTFPYRRSLQTGRPWSRCSRRWGNESNLVLPGAGPVVASWPASGFQLSGGQKTGLKCLLTYIYSPRDNRIIAQRTGVRERNSGATLPPEPTPALLSLVSLGALFWPRWRRPPEPASLTPLTLYSRALTVPVPVLLVIVPPSSAPTRAPRYMIPATSPLAVLSRIYASFRPTRPPT